MSAGSVLGHGQPVSSPPDTGKAGSVAELAARLAPLCLDVVDVDEVAARIEAAGINDRVCAQRFGHPSVFQLADAVLTHLHRDYGHQLRRRAARALPAVRPEPYAGQALLRSALYLTPLLLALAAHHALEQVSWQGPAAVIVLGWATSQLLGYLGHVVKTYRGAGPATRLLASGFLAVAAVWCAALSVVPSWLGETSPGYAYAVTLTELALFASVTTALVTGAEATLLRWLLPSGAGATLMALGWWPHWPPLVDELALMALLLPALAQTFRSLRAPAVADGGTVGRLAGADLRPAAAYMAIGLAQATAFVIVWRLAPTGTASALALAPLVAAVPLLELFIGWHTCTRTAMLGTVTEQQDEHQPIRRLHRLTLAMLATPLLTGAALAGAYRAASGADARRLVLALTAGVLLAGVYGAVLLLATQRRLVAAAVLASAPAFGILALTPTDDLLPGTVVVLAAVGLGGLGVCGWLAGRDA